MSRGQDSWGSESSSECCGRDAAETRCAEECESVADRVGKGAEHLIVQRHRHAERDRINRRRADRRVSEELVNGDCVIECDRLAERTVRHGKNAGEDYYQRRSKRCSHISPLVPSDGDVNSSRQY